jgi:hypothetical protein
MTQISLTLTVIASMCLALLSSARCEEVGDVLARARKLNEAGEPSEATAVLARALAQTHDPRLLSEWLVTNDRWGTDVESHRSHTAMPPMPQVDEAEFKKKLGNTAWTTLREEYTEHFADKVLFGVELNPFAPYARALGATDAFYKEIRGQLSKKVPPVLTEQKVNTELRSIEEYGRSAFSCESAISRALQSAPTGEIDRLLPLKKQAQEQKSRVQRVRAEFISYDHIAPRVISAHVSLIPDAFGVKGPYVTAESLKQAAEMLGESGRDLEFAHKDVKRLWLDAMSKLKEATGEKQFKDLETLATVVANSKQTPDSWEPK